MCSQHSYYKRAILTHTSRLCLLHDRKGSGSTEINPYLLLVFQLFSFICIY